MVDLQGQDVLAILTRAPSAGGKTRLFAELGSAPRRDLLAALLLDTLDAAQIPAVHRVACFTPAAAEEELRRLLPSDVELMTQRGTDLGARMCHTFDGLFARGAASVVLIGSDLPGLDRRAIAGAYEVLRTRPEVVVFGPATDGGFYLIGATRTPAALLRDIPWGGADALAAAEAQARRAAVATVNVSTAGDVDTLRDLRELLASDAPARRIRALLHAECG